MKGAHMKKGLILIIALMLCLAIIGCGNEDDQAKKTAEAFLTSVAEGNFENARTYLHPSREIDVEKRFNNYESWAGIDFQKGINIKKYTDYSYSVYDDDVGGSEYELEIRVSVDGKRFEIGIDIVRNDNGYGIYEIEFD